MLYNGWKMCRSSETHEMFDTEIAKKLHEIYIWFHNLLTRPLLRNEATSTHQASRGQYRIRSGLQRLKTKHLGEKVQKMVERASGWEMGSTFSKHEKILKIEPRRNWSFFKKCWHCEYPNSRSATVNRRFLQIFSKKYSYNFQIISEEKRFQHLNSSKML